MADIEDGSTTPEDPRIYARAEVYFDQLIELVLGDHEDDDEQVLEARASLIEAEVTDPLAYKVATASAELHLRTALTELRRLREHTAEAS